MIVDFERTGADIIVFSVFTVILTLYYSYVVYNITNTARSWTSSPEPNPSARRSRTGSVPSPTSSRRTDNA